MLSLILQDLTYHVLLTKKGKLKKRYVKDNKAVKQESHNQRKSQQK